MIENPVSTLSTYWRKPDHTFDPCDYGGYVSPPADQYTKKTCLWVGNGFVMPKTRPVEPVLGSKMHFVGPSPERANLRSATPLGFAYAVFQANCPEVIEIQRTGDSGHAIMRGVDGEPDDESGRN